MTGPTTRRAAVGPRAELVLTGILSGVGIVLLAIMLGYVIVNALSRTLVRAPFAGATEVVGELLMPVLVAASIVLATLYREHVAVDVVYDRFPPSLRRGIRVGVGVLFTLVLAVGAAYSWSGAMFAFHRGVALESVALPKWPVAFAIPAAFLASAILVAIDVARDVRRAPGTGGPDPEETRS